MILHDVQNPLLHHLNVYFCHVDLPRELGWELGGLQQLCIDRGRHVDGCSRGCVGEKEEAREVAMFRLRGRSTIY